MTAGTTATVSSHSRRFLVKEQVSGDFPGPVVKNLPCSARDGGSIPARGTKIPTCLGAAKPLRHSSSVFAAQWKLPLAASKTRCSQIKIKEAGPDVPMLTLCEDRSPQSTGQ